MEGMDLNCAWRSAECVTSLYDRVRELELRNAELEAEVMQWRDQSRQSRMTDASTSVDLAKAIRERDEWRDRFKQQDDISRRLQKRVDAMQEEHKEQVAKLQERCLFDPNGPKRVQVCVASLQKTLDNRVQEHELMHQRLRETLDINAALTRANATMEQERASFVGAIARHSAHRMFTLLHRLRKDVMVAAWSAWSRSTIRVSERQAREEGIQRLALVVKQSKQQRLQRQITRFTLQRARSTRSQVIKAWAFQTLAMRLARHRALDSYHASCRLIVSNAFKTWHERSVRRAHCTKVLLQLCDNHKRTRVHRGFSTWVQASRTLLIEMILLKCDVVEAEKANVVAELEGLKQNLSVSLAAQRSWEQAVRDLEIEHATAASNQDHMLNEWTTRLAVIYERGTSRRLQGLIFHAWKLRDVHRRHVRALLAHVQAQKLRALVRQWRQSLQTRHAATPMQHMQKRRHGRIQRETFAWWASQTRRAATRRRKLTHRRQLQAATSMQRHWRLWRESVARSVQRKARGASALHALAGMVGLHIQQRSFKAWEATVMGLVQRDLRLKWVVDTALSQSRMHRLGHVLARWKRYATLQRKQTVSLAFQARRRLDRLHVWAHSVWRMWFAQCAVQIHRRSALAEVVGRLRHRWLRRAVSQWAANGHLIAMHARFEQTVDELNRSMRLLQEHIQHQQAQHRSEADAMEVTMQITEESHQRAMAISATEWSQKLHQVQVDLERTEALRDALEGAAAEWHGHAKLELRRGQALETMLMESQAQWQHSFDLQSMQHHRHHMLEEDARSAIYRLDDVVRRMAAAWDAETRLHRDKLLEMSIAHDQMQAKVGAQALECLLQRTTVYCLNRWKAFVSTTKATKAKVSHVMAVLQANHIALVYDRWKQFHRMHQARKQLCAKWHHIHASTLVTTAFRAWAANAADRRKLATMLQLFGVSMVRKTYEFVWRQWHRTASERKQARMLWTRAVARLSKHWYKVGLRRWKDVADAIASAKRAQFRIQALDHATNTVQRKWNHIVCRQVLVWWRDNVSSIRRQRELLKRCATRFQHFAVGRVFEVWRENAWVQRRDRFACDLLVGLCLRHCVQSAWVQWRQHRLVSAQLETQRMHEAYRVTQQELLAAKTAIESLTSHVASSQAATASLCDTTKQLKLQLQASKCMHMFQSTIRTSFSEWKRVTAMFKQTKGNVRLIVRRMQRLHQAMVLDMWKAFIIRRHAKAGRAVAATALHRTWSHRQAWRAWVLYVHQTKRLQQKCQWIAQAIATTSAQYVWKTWRGFQQHQRRACDRLVAVSMALEGARTRRTWLKWCSHIHLLKAQDEAIRNKATRVLLYLRSRTASTVRRSLDTWLQFVARQRTKRSHEVLCRRWICRNVWRRWRCRIDQDRQYRKVLVQFTRRVLRHSWTRWQLGLAKWTKHTLESQMAKDRDEWERERGEVGRRAMAMEEQVQQVCAELAGKERALQDLQTHLLAVEISRDVKYHHHHVVEDKLTTVLTSTRQAMTLQLNLRRAWSMWTALVRRRRVTRERAFEWLEIKQRAQLETLFSSWKAHLVAYRRRLRLELKFKRRRLDQAVERWRVRTASRLQLKAAVTTVVQHAKHKCTRELALAWRHWLVHVTLDAQHIKQCNMLASTQKCAADLRAKWGLSLMAWRLRWVHVRKTTWGFQRWKLAAIQHAWRVKLQYTVGQLDQAHQLLLDEQEAVLAQREHMVLPLRATWRALSQAKTLEQLFDAVASPCLADTSGMLYLVDPVKQELWSIVKKNTHMVTAPVHVGIAGFVVGSGATCRTPAVAQDTRFHPLVDQYVVNSIMASATSSVVDRIQMVCVPIVSDDGVVWGVVQMAYLNDAVEVFIVCHACASAVECVLHDLLKSSRDAVAARSPTKLIKLFKQHKQWRKYYLDVEIRLRQAQDELKQVEGTHTQHLQTLQEHLHNERDAAEATVGRLRDQLQQKELDLQAQIHALERQAASDQHERKAKEDELHHVIWTLQNEHQLTRARDLISSARHAATTDAAILPPRQPDDSSTTHVLLAEIQALKNQLVRAETDAQFLSKTIRVAIKYEGNLPDVMIAEVKRIGRRLKKATSE